MAYTIPGVTRCSARSADQTRCALAVGHVHHHVTVGGRHFAAAGGQPVTPQLPEPLPVWAGQSFDQWAQDQGMAPAAEPRPTGTASARILLERDGEVLRSAYSVSDLLERNKQRADEFASFKAGVEKTLEHLADQASRHANTLGALGQTCDRLENTLNRSRRAHQNLGETVAGHDQRLAEQRQDLNHLIGMTGDGDVWNERKQLATSESLLAVSDIVHRRADDAAQRLTNVEEQGRISAEAIQRLEEQDTPKRLNALREATLMNVEQLTERLTKLEEKFGGLVRVPMAWGHKSLEPPRHQTYQDADGDLWQCRGELWFCVRTGGAWSEDGDGVTWPFDDFGRKYFPWKVWNGRD